MAKAFTYKRTTTTNMKVAGILSTDDMLIDVDGEIKSLVTLLSDFDGEIVEIAVKTKDEKELDEPAEEVDADALASDED